MNKKLNIGIIGAGSAGLACAIALAQRGHRVAIFEKHETIAPIGAGILLQPQGIAALAELGCEKSIKTISSPIALLEVRNHKNQGLLEIPYATGRIAYGVTRGALTNMLQARIKELGGRFELNVHVGELTETPSGVLVQEAHQPNKLHRTWHFDAIVLACGSNSLLAQKTGFGDVPKDYEWGALNGLIEVDSWSASYALQQRVHGARYMIGLLPSGRAGDKLKLSFYWSLPTAQYEQWQTRDWSDFIAEAKKLWPSAEPVLDILRREDLTFARYRHVTPSTYAIGRIALVGDAAHAMSPQLGLGTTLALEDALELARCLNECATVQEGIEAYSTIRKPASRAKQLLSKLMTPMFQSRMPAWIRDPILRLNRYTPGALRLMRASLGH